MALSHRARSVRRSTASTGASGTSSASSSASRDESSSPLRRPGAFRFGLIATLGGGLTVWVEAVRTIVAGCSEDEQARLFHRNAERIYRLG